MQPGQAVAMIEVPPLPVGEMVIERGPSTTYRATKGGIAPVRQPKIELVLLRVESNALDPPGVLESQESGEESPVAHSRDLIGSEGYRASAGKVDSQGKQRRGEGGGGFGGRDLGVLLVPPPERASDTARGLPSSTSLEHEWLRRLDSYPHETRKNHIIVRLKGADTVVEVWTSPTGRGLTARFTEVVRYSALAGESVPIEIDGQEYEQVAVADVVARRAADDRTTAGET